MSKVLKQLLDYSINIPIDIQQVIGEYCPRIKKKNYVYVLVNEIVTHGDNRVDEFQNSTWQAISIWSTKKLALQGLKKFIENDDSFTGNAFINKIQMNNQNELIYNDENRIDC
jgi:hypothetical protein